MTESLPIIPGIHHEPAGNTRCIKLDIGQVMRACTSLARAIEQRYLSFTKTLAIPRGGLVPASIVRNSFERARLITSPGQAVKGDFVLVVDDICDSGHTLQTVAESLDKKGIAYKTAVLVLRAGADFQPDFHAITVLGDPWVVFPWE